jgi:hypothetical protein
MRMLPHTYAYAASRAGRASRIYQCQRSSICLLYQYSGTNSDGGGGGRMSLLPQRQHAEAAHRVAAVPKNHSPPKLRRPLPVIYIY